MRLRLIRVSAVLVGVVRVAAAAPVGWPADQGGNGHSYEYVPGTLPWTQARVEAPQRTSNGAPGYLATITSPAETNFLTAHFAPIQAWLGGYQDRTAPDYAEPGGGWRWVTGEPLSYTNWASRFGFPDNFGGRQDYLKFAGGRTGGTGRDHFHTSTATILPRISALLNWRFLRLAFLRAQAQRGWRGWRERWSAEDGRWRVRGGWWR